MKPYIASTLLMLTCLAPALPAFAQDSVPAAASSNAQTLKPEEIEQLVASIALYPDELLSQVMIASTYPLEVVEADRFMRAHKDMKGDALTAALKNESWDDSVKALTQTPDVLATMSKNLDWTQKLGDTVLAQQKDVMDAVQKLRAKAYAQKTLQTTSQQNVTVDQGSSQQTIIIESAQPQTVYVPYYEPTVVYGAWPYPEYPPYYYPPPPGYGIVSGLAAGIAFGAGVAIANDVWDTGFDWHHDDIDVDIHNDININHNEINNISNRLGRGGSGTQWQHNPEHRHGVAYNNQAVGKKFTPQRTATAPKAAELRQQFRGHADQAFRPARPATSGQLGNRAQNMRQSDIRSGLENRAASSGHLAGRTNNAPSFSGLDRDSAFSGIGNGHRTLSESSRGRESLQRSAPQRPEFHPQGGRIGGGGGRFRR